jgi:cell division protein ZapA
MPETDQNPQSAPAEAVSNPSEAATEQSPAVTPPAEPVTVDIYDQTYHLYGDDPAYIQKLADMVDNKMRLVASHGRTVDSLRVAVLAALNIADELSTLERRYHSLAGTKEESGNLRDRAHTLNGLLDSILEDERKLG